MPSTASGLSTASVCPIWPGGMRLFLGLALIALVARPVRAQATHVAAADTTGIVWSDLRTALLLTGAYCVAGAVVMENIWYRDQAIVRFHFFNDNRGYLQVDKFGHAFGAYVQSYVGYHWLRKTGAARTGALLYGGALGLVLQTPIEVMDGIHEGWGFSWGDMAANAAGSGLVVGQELLFGEQIVKYKFSYSGSRYADVSNGYFGETALNRMLEDYNGHTYWLTVPLERLLGKDRISGWLHVAVGYGADGMIGEFENIREYRGVAIPETTRYRQYLLSLDIDWTRIETKSRLLRAMLHGLAFVKLPFPAVEVNSTGRLRGYWMYF